MKKYTHLDGTKIIYKGFLPKEWNGIQDFNLLSEEELNGHGFFEAIDVYPEEPLKPYQYYARPVITHDGNKRIFTVLAADHDDEWLARAIELELDRLKEHRNKLLTDTDWTQLPDNDLTVEQKADYASYRSAVRQVVKDIEDQLTEMSDLKEQLMLLVSDSFPAKPA